MTKYTTFTTLNRTHEAKVDSMLQAIVEPLTEASTVRLAFAGWRNRTVPVKYRLTHHETNEVKEIDGVIACEDKGSLQIEYNLRKSGKKFLEDFTNYVEALAATDDADTDEDEEDEGDADELGLPPLKKVWRYDQMIAKYDDEDEEDATWEERNSNYEDQEGNFIDFDEWEIEWSKIPGDIQIDAFPSSHEPWRILLLSRSHEICLDGTKSQGLWSLEAAGKVQPHKITIQQLLNLLSQVVGQGKPKRKLKSVAKKTNNKRAKKSL